MEEKRTVVTEAEPTQERTVQREETVAAPAAAPKYVMAKRVIWFIAGVIIAFLIARVVLLLLAANPDNAFVAFVYAVSEPFAMPFYGMFNYQPSYRSATLEISSLVAIAVYALIAWGITKLLSLSRA